MLPAKRFFWMILCPISTLIIACSNGSMIKRGSAAADSVVTIYDTISTFSLQQMAPMLGYLQARRVLLEPFDLLGGAVAITLRQDSGNVTAAIPHHRRIDPRVFGTPQFPENFSGTPMIHGLPFNVRGTQEGAYTTVTAPTPFGDSVVTLSQGRVFLDMRDRTATDAADSRDSIHFEASWADTLGNIYMVRCNQVLSHGLEFPTFGGVVTNHILHGASRIGIPLMPTVFAYAAFWGTGEVLKNDSVVHSPALVHGLFTENTRREDEQLALDNEVDATRRRFHVIVPPYAATDTAFIESPVRTGFVLDDGEELPFRHVVFEDIQVSTRRVPSDTLSLSFSEESISAASDTGPEPGAIIEMSDGLRFIPGWVTITRGSTVRWRNVSGVVHTVTSDSSLAENPRHARKPANAKSFNSGEIAPGQTFSHTFTVRGEYRYFSIPSQGVGMVGRISVR